MFVLHMFPCFLDICPSKTSPIYHFPFGAPRGIGEQQKGHFRGRAYLVKHLYSLTADAENPEQNGKLQEHSKLRE
jgi:hypothetical protein